MAITLLRRQSDVPTVQGQDDSRMMRYAVVHDGVTRGYQSECGYRTSGSTFTVLSGEIIVDGWQAIIDSLGCAVQAISSSTKMYYIVYVEYDLRISDQQSVTIKSTYTSGAFPEITPGDDLTENPNGLRRFALYRFTIQNGTISGVERLFSYCEVGDSKNVTTSINGKAISDIFESNGTTAKKATHATTIDKSLFQISRRGKHEDYDYTITTIAPTDTIFLGLSDVYEYLMGEAAGFTALASGWVNIDGKKCVIYQVRGELGNHMYADYIKSDGSDIDKIELPLSQGVGVSAISL